MGGTCGLQGAGAFGEGGAGGHDVVDEQDGAVPHEFRPGHGKGGMNVFAPLAGGHGGLAGGGAGADENAGGVGNAKGAGDFAGEAVGMVEAAGAQAEERHGDAQDEHGRLGTGRARG